MRKISYIFLFIIFWYVTAHFCIQNHFVLPGPVVVLESAYKNWEVIFHHALVTFSEMALAIVFSISLAVPLALAMFALPKVGRSMQGLFLILKCLPSFALSPLIVFFVGFGKVAVLIPATLMLLFPITIGLYRGLTAAPKAVLEAFHLWKAPWYTTFFQVQIPYALPQFFSGLRVSLGLVGTAVLAGEWVASDAGLGFLLLDVKESLDFSLSYAVLLVLFTLSASWYLFGIVIEKSFLRRFRFVHFVAISLLFAGCSHKDEKVKTLMLDWTLNPNHIPLFYGKDLGLFEKEGINLQLKTPGYQDPLQLVAAGLIDGCVTTLSRTMRAVEAGADIVVVGVLIDKTMSGVLVKDSYNRVGISTKTASQTCKTLFSRNGIMPQTWIQVRVDLLVALSLGEVDAVWGVFSNIEGVQCRHMGIDGSFVSATQLGCPARAYEMVVVSRPNAFDSSFAKALQSSLDTSRASPEKAFQVYQQHKNSVQEWEKDAWHETVSVLTHQQSIPQEDVDELRAWLIDAQVLISL